MPRTIPLRMEFHISRQARDRYQFDEVLFALSGNALLTNFQAARSFAQKMNAARDLQNRPETAVRAGDINAMGLIDEILHLVMQRYREQHNPTALAKALNWLEADIGVEALENALWQFSEQFPPLLVYQGEIELADYLAGESRLPNGSIVSNRELALEEMLFLWLANANPAFAPFQELFADADLAQNSAYSQIIASLYSFFIDQPAFEGKHIIDVLRAPALAAPYSLSGQLDFIRGRWAVLFGEFITRLLSSLDLIKEEQKPFFGFGPGPVEVYEFSDLEIEPERFSPDRDWMPNVVLMAKNAFVWLDQLSKKYLRPITRLDQIPDQELDALARWGFSGLWLIGLWERSPASRTIKQMRGNPEAVASAYSLFSYDIAAALGGEQAYASLKERAWQRGIRLASDMVPNHMGIDSRWVVEHPDWFIALPFSPFPGYTFNGPNLSWDSRVGIYLEDHYYDNTDAAVVFKRLDFWTGNELYIYHGNDGTSMPWNDTAQLDYLQPVVREAVIQTILHVARKFPIIRFDAAMTLAKRHYQRLWFPEPGSGGDIPSRSEYGLNKEQFDAAFPVEFWREVVDRVAQEAPDTLLLAEAFWMMEGYFVRTLGMHRVYNSAFMNMLRDEKNQEYRLVIKNTLEFDPEILKRYVNFMNNPDERTAVDQFGKEDKYFGVCTMMATLPGLPMFGHGQIEGYSEKYGMEYQKAYYEEAPDAQLVDRHRREIFPLLRRRYLFAEASDFLLYDFYTPQGAVNEDVFAYSNRSGDDRSLIVFHNKFANAAGWIRLSAAYPLKTGDEGERTLMQLTLGQGLGLQARDDHYTIFRDHISGMEYIRNNRDLHQQGLYVELGAYKYHVFLDFRQVEDDPSGQYARLADSLAGRGTPSMDEALKEMHLAPILGSFRELMNGGMLSWLIQNRWKPANVGDETFDRADYEKALDEFQWKNNALLAVIQRLNNWDTGEVEPITEKIRVELEACLALPVLDLQFPELNEDRYAEALAYLKAGPEAESALAEGEPVVWGPLLAWVMVYRLGMAYSPDAYQERSRAWIDDWLFGKVIAEALQQLGLENTRQQVTLVRLFTGQTSWLARAESSDDIHLDILNSWFQDEEIQRFLQVHPYEDVLWFRKESFDLLCWWAFAFNVVQDRVRFPTSPSETPQGEPSETPVKNERSFPEAMLACYQTAQELLAAAEKSGYRVDRLLGTEKTA